MFLYLKQCLKPPLNMYLSMYMIIQLFLPLQSLLVLLSRIFSMNLLSKMKTCLIFHLKIIHIHYLFDSKNTSLCKDMSVNLLQSVIQMNASQLYKALYCNDDLYSEILFDHLINKNGISIIRTGLSFSKFHGFSITYFSK